MGKKDKKRKEARKMESTANKKKATSSNNAADKSAGPGGYTNVLKERNVTGATTNTELKLVTAEDKEPEVDKQKEIKFEVDKQKEIKFEVDKQKEIKFEVDKQKENKPEIDKQKGKESAVSVVEKVPSNNNEADIAVQELKSVPEPPLHEDNCHCFRCRKPHEQQWIASHSPTHFSTGMSSLPLAANNLKATSTADFIGDVQCFKKLFKYKVSDQPLSFLLHRAMKSVLVDYFDILDATCDPNLSFAFKNYEPLRDFIKDVVGENKEQILMESRPTLEEYCNKNAMIDLFYACLGKEINYEPKTKDGLNSKTKGQFRGSDLRFSSTLWNIGSRNILVGYEIPYLTREIDGLEKKITLGVQKQGFLEGSIAEANGVEMWLTNKIVGAEQTYIGTYKPNHQSDYRIEFENKDFVNTEDIPKRASFDPKKLTQDFLKLLDEIYNTVSEPQHSYWLYRAPDQDSFKIYDVTAELQERGMLPKPPSKNEMENGKIKGSGNPFPADIFSIVKKAIAAYKPEC